MQRSPQRSYCRIGELRNTVQHFAAPHEDYCAEVFRYLCYVADPVLNHFWDVRVFEAIVEGWDEQDSYLFDEEPWIEDALKNCDIEYNRWIPTPDVRR